MTLVALLLAFADSLELRPASRTEIVCDVGGDTRRSRTFITPEFVAVPVTIQQIAPNVTI